MQISVKAMGDYQTNCYIIVLKGGEIIIDPGVGATKWILSNVKNPKAILNTHGHFDHIWSNASLQKLLNIPLYTPQGDILFLQDPAGYGHEKSFPNIEVLPDSIHQIAGQSVKFWHFPGHTPGCSAIQIGENFFSGDFIFKGSIGRVDFPFSNPMQMRESILKVLQINEDFKVYPGHGASTTLKQEQKSLQNWLSYI